MPRMTRQLDLDTPDHPVDRHENVSRNDTKCRSVGRAELGDQAVDHRGVGPARVGAGHPRRGQERVSGLGQGDGTAADHGHAPGRWPARAPRHCHRHWRPWPARRSLRYGTAVTPLLPARDPPSGCTIFRTARMSFPRPAYSSSVRFSPETIVTRYAMPPPRCRGIYRITCVSRATAAGRDRPFGSGHLVTFSDL